MILFGLPATSPSITSRSRADRSCSRPLDFGGARLALGVLGAAREGRPDRADQDLVVERFLDEVDGARLHRLDGKRDVAVTGDHDDRNRDLARPKPALKLDSVHLGHPDVGDDAAGP